MIIKIFDLIYWILIAYGGYIVCSIIIKFYLLIYYKIKKYKGR